MTGHVLVLDEPPSGSDRGLPLANGLLGASIWADGADLIVSLDRTDLWDLREVPEFRGDGYSYADTIRLHREGRHDELRARLEDPYKHPGPTKLPAGRIRVAGAGWDGGRLTLHTATAAVQTHSIGTIHAFVAADGECGHLVWQGERPQLKIEPPAFGQRPDTLPVRTGPSISHADVWDLGYAAPHLETRDGFSGYVVEGAEGFSFAVALGWRGDHACWSIATNAEGADPLAVARDRVAAALELGLADALARHEARWRALWERSAVALPDPDLDRQYHLDLYKLLAAGRRGAPPIALQGPWTSDNGQLPPWKGDYHHDLNTQMTYWPVYKANHLDLGLGFLDWLWDTRDECRDWTRCYFGLPGLNVPMTADLRNRQIGGWRQYTHLASTGAWLAQHFDLHWRYSGDDAFLADRAYPYVEEVCTFIAAVTEARDAEGKRGLALSASPEVNENRPEAWFDTLTTYENALFRYALELAGKMATHLGDAAAATRWSEMSGQFPPLVQDDRGLLIARDVPPDPDHRHLSHLLPIFPLGMYDHDLAAPVVRQSMATLARSTTAWWMGYSFAWAAAVNAHVGDGDGALDLLSAYRDHLYPNSFHANGDWQAKGHTKAVFGAFTLEGNSAAAAAVHNMLLRSRPGVVDVFPALPSEWRTASFRGFLADGGIEVDAALSDDGAVAITLRAPHAINVQLRAPGLPPTDVELRPHVVQTLSRAPRGVAA